MFERAVKRGIVPSNCQKGNVWLSNFKSHHQKLEKMNRKWIEADIARIRAHSWGESKKNSSSFSHSILYNFTAHMNPRPLWGQVDAKIDINIACEPFLSPLDYYNFTESTARSTDGWSTNPLIAGKRTVANWSHLEIKRSALLVWHTQWRC